MSQDTKPDTTEMSEVSRLAPAFLDARRGEIDDLLTARLDTRAGQGKIASRIGLSATADTFDGATDLFAHLSEGWSALASV